MWCERVWVFSSIFIVLVKIMKCRIRVECLKRGKVRSSHPEKEESDWPEKCNVVSSFSSLMDVIITVLYFSPVILFHGKRLGVVTIALKQSKTNGRGFLAKPRRARGLR